MKQYVLCGVALFMMAGCGQPAPQDAPPTAAGGGLVITPNEDPISEIPPANVNLKPSEVKDIGDAEQLLRLGASLAERSESPLIEQKLLETMREEISLSTIVVQQPHPSELWIKFSAYLAENFVLQPLVVRAKVFRDNEEIGQFQTVLGKWATSWATPEEGVTLPPKQFEFNVLEGLPLIPETMLVHAEAELLLLPIGTDELTVDPATATADPEFVIGKRSNPVRITFNQGPA